MWTSTTGFSINVLMLDHKLRQRLHYSFDSDFHVRPGYIIAFRKELISWKQKSELGDKIAIFVRTTNGSIHYISNMKLLEITENRKYLWVFLFFLPNNFHNFVPICTNGGSSNVRSPAWPFQLQNVKGGFSIHQHDLFHFALMHNIVSQDGKKVYFN